MTDPVRGESRLSSRTFPLCDMDQATSRTTPGAIFSCDPAPVLLSSGLCGAGKNRARHRRSRGRCAVLDPACSTSRPASFFRRSGGDYDTSGPYRRASGRTRMERRSSRNCADRGRIAGRSGGAGTTAKGHGLTLGSDVEGRRSRPSPCSWWHDGAGGGGAFRGEGAECKIKGRSRRIAQVFVCTSFFDGTGREPRETEQRQSPDFIEPSAGQVRLYRSFPPLCGSWLR